MKLKQYRVREFRSVWDSGVIKAGDVACLVGKNEAGKTALLQALYRLNPIVATDGKFSIDDDYPRKEVGEYQHQIETEQRQHATVIEAMFLLDDSDAKAVADVFGPNALRSGEIVLTKGYESERTFALNFDETAARRHLASSNEFVDALRADLNGAEDWEAFDQTLASAEKTAEVTRVRTLVAQLKGKGAAGYTYDQILEPRVPKFLYFDEYYQLEGQENIQALIKRKAEGALKKSDHPLLGLINIARLNLSDLLNVTRTVELTNKLEGASNHLSKQILRYWSQNKHLQMKFDVREGKPKDPLHMQNGANIWGKVYDQVHWAHTELSSRSKGFVWFFSFLAWYEDVKRGKQNVVLLLDEPGLSLHGKAQADLLRYIEQELKPHHQVIFTTHSPFMIDPNHFDRVRIVQDLGIDANDPLPKEEDGTKVLTEVFDATDDSLFPLQGALGYEIHQTLFVGPNSLVVEGGADMLFLRGMSDLIEREGGVGLSEKWVITPVGGAGKVPTFVALLAPQRGLNIATLLDFQSEDQDAIESLYTKKLLERKKVLTYRDFTGTKEADVEDMFERDFYLGLVNAEYAKALNAPLALSDLNSNIPRIVRQIDDSLTRAPLRKGEFGHYRPARYFFENAPALAPKISAHTKERFTKAFERLNALLK